MVLAPPGELRGQQARAKEGASLAAAASAGRRDPGQDSPSAFCLLFHYSSLKRYFFPGLLFFDDSFTDSSMPAFHFNDSIAVKPSHAKA